MSYNKSELFGRVDTLTSDPDSTPFPMRTSEQTTERNFVNENIKRFDSQRNYDSSEAASKIDHLMKQIDRDRAKTQRVINRRTTNTASRLNQKITGNRTKANSPLRTQSVLSQLSKDQRRKLLLKRKNTKQNSSSGTGSLLDDLSSYRKMTMTDRSAMRGSRITTFRKTNNNVTERLDGPNQETIRDSFNDKSSSNNKQQHEQYSSFYSLSRTDQNFWKQLEHYRYKHIKWIEEKKSLHDKLKKLQRENDGLSRKVKVLKNQITAGIVNQEGPPDFDLSNIMALSRHQYDIPTNNNISQIYD